MIPARCHFQNGKDYRQNIRFIREIILVFFQRIRGRI